MGTFHIVRIDFQLGFGVDLCICREQQVLVALLRVGFLSMRLHHDPTMEYRVSAVTQHTFVALTTGAFRCVMRNVGMVIDMTAPEGKVGPVEVSVSPFGIKVDPGIVANPSPSHRNGGGFKFGGLRQAGEQSTHVEGALGLILRTAVVQCRVLVEDDLGERIAERTLCAKRDMTLDDAGLAALAENDKIARQAQEALPAAARNEEQLNGLVQLDTRSDLHQGAVTYKS